MRKNPKTYRYILIFVTFVLAIALICSMSNGYFKETVAIFLISIIFGILNFYADLNINIAYNPNDCLISEYIPPLLIYKENHKIIEDENENLIFAGGDNPDIIEEYNFKDRKMILKYDNPNKYVIQINKNNNYLKDEKFKKALDKIKKMYDVKNKKLLSVEREIVHTELIETNKAIIITHTNIYLITDYEFTDFFEYNIETKKLKKLGYYDKYYENAAYKALSADKFLISGGKRIESTTEERKHISNDNIIIKTKRRKND